MKFPLLVRLLVLLPLGGCFWFDENSQQQLANNYYLDNTSEGDNRLYFGDANSADVEEPLIVSIAATGKVEDWFVVSKSGEYYLFSLNAKTDEIARKTRIGPLNTREFRWKLYQIIGDSSLQLTTAYTL
ncbi:MAG: hypothetical protein M3Y54_01515 [Bacteroidota bacterium]|nr:hypothetical protein [Bacteroidota bacterium]